MQSDSGARRDVHAIAAPAFLGNDAGAALAVSLTAAEHATTDALAAHTTRATTALTSHPSQPSST